MTAANPRRRDEILDAAERRFTSQGYLHTSIAELIADTGIAKGTFYHHFSSKEEVMGAVIDRHVDQLRVRLEALADQHDVPAVDRLVAALAGTDAHHPDERALTDELERDGNEVMRLRALNATVTAVTPALARILADGRDEGTFSLADAVATAAAFATVTTQLVDRDLMGWVAGRDHARLAGLIAAAEQLLGARPGTLVPLAAALTGPEE